MKNILYRVIVVLLLLSPAVLTSQPSLYYYYYKLVPSPVVYNLNHMFGHIAVGDNGTVLKTTNGGLTFSQVQNIPVYNYNAIGSLVSGAGNLYITIVGDNGKIIYAVKPDSLFTEQISPVTVNLNGAYVRNYSPYFYRIAVGDNGTIIRSVGSSSSNWSSWTVVNSGVTEKLNQVNLSFLFGLVVGNNGRILRTTNKGENWTVVNSGVSNNLYSVNAYIDSSAIVCGTGGVILKSTNLGLNWTQLNSGTTADLFSVFKYITAGNGGTIKFSYNEGVNWINHFNSYSRKLNSIQTLQPSIDNSPGSVIVGDSGTIIRKDIDSSYIYKILDNNSIKSFFITTGIFDHNISGDLNSPGFEWPKGSNKYANYSSGLSTAAKVNGQLRQAMCTYGGEYYPGYCNNGVAASNANFRIYSVRRGDSHLSNPDWQNWGLMVPYGAPYVDVNMSGNYEPMIDTPGVKNASQTVFMCLTDGFPESHKMFEGSGGGTLPLYAELHLTAWSYSQPSYTDMQFVKFDVINKGVSPWTNTFFSLFADAEIGDAIDDYIGCDTARDLAFGYNADNDDPVYGSNPPAFGLLLLKGAYNKYSSPQKQYDMTSSVTIIKYTECMGETSGEPYPAYFNMKGFKKDSTAWLDPTYTPPKKTKFSFSGDPETNIGWTNPKGVIYNCNLDSTGQIVSVLSGDKKLLLNTGDESITVMPGDTQRIVMCQLIARGNNNLNSVTKLKELSDIARNFYNTNYTIGINTLSTEIPSDFSLEQNYPNPFNSSSNVKFQIINSGIIKIKVYDILGKEVKTIVNEYMQPGTYNVRFDANGLSSGVYFYKMTAGDFVATKKFVLLK